MKKAGILINKDHDYAYIDTFIGFLERIINIIMKVFEKLSSLGSKATPTDGEQA